MVIVTVAAVTSSTVRWDRRRDADENQNNCDNLFRFHLENKFFKNYLLKRINE